jgi:hypothetical protein
VIVDVHLACAMYSVGVLCPVIEAGVRVGPGIT